MNTAFAQLIVSAIATDAAKSFVRIEDEVTYAPLGSFEDMAETKHAEIAARFALMDALAAEGLDTGLARRLQTHLSRKENPEKW